MARPVRRAADRWPSRKHASGYVKPTAKGVAWLHYAQLKRTSGLRFIPANRHEAVAMLDAWIDTLKADPAETRMLLDVLSEYNAAHIQQCPPGEKAISEQAFLNYFPPDDPAVTALRFRSKDLKAYLVRRHEELAAKLKRDTLTNYRRRVSRLFTAYAIPRDYIDANPAAVLAKGVGRPGKSEVLIWTREEVEQIVKQARERIVGLRWLWQYLTGMRPSEAVRMRWEDYAGGGLTIYGAAKGAPKSGDIERDGMTLRPRAFVVRPPKPGDSPAVAAWMQRMIDTLEEARQHDDGSGYIWGEDALRRHGVIRSDQFLAAVKRAGIERNGRRYYDLRASAGDMMETELGLSNSLIADLSGHDTSVRLTKYRPARSVERLEKRISERGE